MTADAALVRLARKHTVAAADVTRELREAGELADASAGRLTRLQRHASGMRAASFAGLAAKLSIAETAADFGSQAEVFRPIAALLLKSLASDCRTLARRHVTAPADRP